MPTPLERATTRPPDPGDGVFHAALCRLGGREGIAAGRGVMEAPVHVPVMVEEVLDLLRPGTGEVILDLTVGAGGHAARILGRAGPAGRLIGIDRDPAVLEIARQVLEPFGERVILASGVSEDLRAILGAHGIGQVDAILLDLGMSSFQLDDPARGFSFSKPGPLDMRMTPGKGRTALELITSSSAPELERILFTYGEEPAARRIAARLTEVCRRRPPRTTQELAAFIESIAPYAPRGRRRVHPATRVFQALRIAVNDELGVLERTLPAMEHVLAPGGRMVMIAFHSLEDRIVKNYLRDARREGRLETLTRKPLAPSDEELAANPRSRSARLRAARRPMEAA